MSEPAPTIILVSDARDADGTRGVGDGAAVRRVRLRDRDHLDEYVAAGARCIRFRCRADLLESLWRDEIDVAAWLRAGVCVEFLAEGQAAATSERDDAAWISEIVASWAAHRRRQRRARTIAGVILSIVALAAAYLALR